jgi:hypothetical protein
VVFTADKLGKRGRFHARLDHRLRHRHGARSGSRLRLGMGPAEGRWSRRAFGNAPDVYRGVSGPGGL